MTPLSAIDLVRHRDADEWAQAVAGELDALLAREIATTGKARLLLSGGTTPAPAYEALALRRDDWSAVEIGLADERWLSPGDCDSNAHLVRESLLTHAPDARFVPLVRDGSTLADCVHVANLQAQHAPRPCVVVLGMGNDGHTASLFPGARDLARVFANPHPYAALDATGCPVSGAWPLRITLTPAGLQQAARRMLLIRGNAKLELLQRALDGDDPNEFPVRVVLRIPGPPLRVHWCE